MRRRTKIEPSASKGTRPAGFPAMSRALRGVVFLALLGAAFVATGAEALADAAKEAADAMNRAIAEARKEGESAGTSEKVQIFKDYTYGMTRQEVRQRSGAWPCDDPDLKGDLCVKKPISFAGTTWQQVFSFDASGLDTVLLAKEDIGPEEVATVFQVLGDENSIVYMTNGGVPFDLLEAVRLFGLKEARAMGRKYLTESLLDGTDLEAMLFPNTYIERMLRGKNPSALLSLANAPGNLRVIELALSQEDETLLLSFSTPVQYIQKMKKKNIRERF